MKTKILHLIMAFCFLGSLSVKTVALNYTITFTGTGASSTVESVIVQNLTQGTSVTVPAGNVLNLSDVPTAVEQVSANDETIRVYPASVDGKSIVSFLSKQTGVTQINAFSMDGRKVAEISAELPAGSNTFELSLPKGVFVIQVTGNEYVYTSKILNQTGKQNNPEIRYIGTEKPASLSPQKSKSSTSGITTMTYTAGDQLLYTATSGTYIASVPDVPIGSKATNFVFSTIPTSAIPAGTFTMGSPETEVDRYSDETQHSVILTAFRISKYEITNAQYATFLNAKSISSNGFYAAGAYPTQALIYASWGSQDWGLHYSGSRWIPVAGYETSPVIDVPWYGAAEYSTYLGGSLPTEAQWEYACRAGTSTPFSTGRCLTNTDANYTWLVPYSSCTNTVTIYPGNTQAIDTYASNAYGLYGMHGNVWEWCADWYGTYPTTVQTNPTGLATGSYRVSRGGSWDNYAAFCRSADRGYGYPNSGNDGLGFRVVFVP